MLPPWTHYWIFSSRLEGIHEVFCLAVASSVVRGNCYVPHHKHFTKSLEILWCKLGGIMKKEWNLETPTSRTVRIETQWLLLWSVSCISISLVTGKNCLQWSNNMNHQVNQQSQYADVTMGGQFLVMGWTLLVVLLLPQHSPCLTSPNFRCLYPC